VALLAGLTACAPADGGELISVAWLDDGAVYAVRERFDVRNDVVRDGQPVPIGHPECEPLAVASAGAGYLAISVRCGPASYGILEVDPRAGAASWLVPPSRPRYRNVAWEHGSVTGYTSTEAGCSRIVRFSDGDEVPVPALLTVDRWTWRLDRNIAVDSTCLGLADWPVLSRDGSALYVLASVSTWDPASLVRFAQPFGGSTVVATGFDDIRGLAVSPDGKLAMVTGHRHGERSAWLVNTVNGVVSDLRFADSGAVAFSPDGRSIGVWTAARGWIVIGVPGDEGMGRWIPFLVVSAALLPLVVVGVILVARGRMRAGGSRREAWVRTIAEFGVVAGTLPWLAMILTPMPRVSGVNLVPFVDLSQMLHAPPLTAFYQIGGNLLVFVAFGFFAPWRWRLNAGHVLVFATLGSVVVETLQYVLNLGRYSSIDDVLLNAGGAFLAAVFSRLVASRLWVAVHDRPSWRTADDLDW
jgi:hypothetical protein